MVTFFKKASRFISAVFVWTFVALDTIFTWAAVALLSPFDRDRNFCHRIVAKWWAQLIVAANPMWRLTVMGKNHVKKGHAYILVSNHSSLTDIICLYHLDRNFKWLAKESLFKMPFFGWTMSLLKYIRLTRGKHGSIRESFQKAHEWLEKGVSVLIFPEGTRSRSGALGEFKNGAFKLALQTGKPIVPIVIHGTQTLLSKGSLAISARGHSSVKILAPIEVARYQPDRFQELRTDVRNLMSQELAAG